MSEYLYCENCGYYPVNVGYHCADCGIFIEYSYPSYTSYPAYSSYSSRTSDSPDYVFVFLAILALITFVVLGSILLASVSFFQNFKRTNFKKALWFGIGGIAWSVFVFYLLFMTNFLQAIELEDFWGYWLLINVTGIIASFISTYLSFSKLNK